MLVTTPWGITGLTICKISSVLNIIFFRKNILRTTLRAVLTSYLL